MKKIIENHDCEIPGKGMPIGNMTSQFFANVYLNELDYFVKHTLKAKYYIRYVDDFVILDGSKEKLEIYKERIREFLNTIKLELHPQKTKVVPLRNGIKLLGFRVYFNYKLLKRSNFRRIPYRFQELIDLYAEGAVDKLTIYESVQGWDAYAMHGNIYKFRRSLVRKLRRAIRKVDKQSTQLEVAVA
jgi:hypothetical protein